MKIKSVKKAAVTGRLFNALSTLSSRSGKIAYLISNPIMDSRWCLH